MDEDLFLILRMKSGDEDAVEEFVRKYYPVILKYCQVRLRNTADAEDITQETFARFFRNFRQYQHYGKAANYLYVIAGNCCRDHYRRHREIPLEEWPQQEAEGMEEQVEVRMALQSLPPELRETATLFFFQGLKQRQIAKILGISLPLVKYRVRRAKEQLSAYLGKEDG